MINLAQLKAAALAATKGPWFAVYGDDYKKRDRYGLSARAAGEDSGYSVSTNPDEHGWETDGGLDYYALSKANADYVALANPSTILALLARLAQVERENAALRAEVVRLKTELHGGCEQTPSQARSEG